YLDTARRAGSPFAINRPPVPWPHFFEETQAGRPGITSIVHSYLTFRIVDLVLNPTNDLRMQPRHAHRTSLWSQLYGRAHFAHFPAAPQSWKQVHSPFINGVGRAIMILALVPTTLMVLGGLCRLAAWWRALPDLRTF